MDCIILIDCTNKTFLRLNKIRYGTLKLIDWLTDSLTLSLSLSDILVNVPVECTAARAK